MQKKSAGILLYRNGSDRGLEVLLVHPGGPYWAKKDDGAWSIPKGEFEDDALGAAKREFAEELGTQIDGDLEELEPVKMKSGKLIYAWKCHGDLDASKITSNTFQMEWPRGSGNMESFPEIDRAAWFGIAEAKLKLHSAQVSFIEQLIKP